MPAAVQPPTPETTAAHRAAALAWKAHRIERTKGPRANPHLPLRAAVLLTFGAAFPDLQRAVGASSEAAACAEKPVRCGKVKEHGHMEFLRLT
jgi:hypothetical protein